MQLAKKNMQAEAIHLHAGKINLHHEGEIATVCGWGTECGETFNAIGFAKYGETLNCMSLTLYNKVTCNEIIRYGDFQRKLICGKSEITEQIVTLVIALQNLSIYIFS